MQDLPYGHGLVYPSSIDLDTGETFGSEESAWFQNALAEGWRSPDGAPVSVEVEYSGDGAQPEVIILNCLDPVYGHSLLKLLNATSVGSRCLVIAPRSLRHVIPDAVTERWIVDAPHSRLRGWLLEFESTLSSQLSQKREAQLHPAFPHPHPSLWNLDDFVTVGAEQVGRPSIVVSLRDDRLWGVDTAAQATNLQQFAAAIRARMPQAGIALVGVSESDFPVTEGVTDLRSAAPDHATESRWLALAKGAELAVGVHGSHMLLPSGLAKASLELLPEHRYDNTLQATLVSATDPELALFRHRAIYGDRALSDVDPKRAADVAVSVIKEADRFAALMAGQAAGMGSGGAALPPSVETRPPPPPPPPPAGRPSVRRALRRVRHRRAERRHEGELAKAADGPLPRILTDSRGYQFELETREEVETYLRYGGHFERAELAVCAAYLEPGMVAVDVGANIGAFTTVLAGGVTTSGSVHSFEPFPAARTRLERTLKLNHLEWVNVYPVAISDDDGSAPFYSFGPGYESWGALGGRTVEVEGGEVSATVAGDVETLRLDTWATGASVDHIDFLKVDVEGAERKLLSGARGLLEGGRIEFALIEVSDSTLATFGDTAADLMRLLEAYDFRTFVADDDRLRPFRIAGRQETLANVFAASAPALARLRSLGLSP